MSVKTGKTVGVVDFIRSEQSPIGLFRIAPGVPCDYALEQASTVMGRVHKLIEAGLLKTSLLHSIGVTDYQQTKTRLGETREQLQKLTDVATDLQSANDRIAALEAERSELLLYKEVAQDWGKGMGEGQLQGAIDDLKALYEAMAAEGSGEKLPSWPEASNVNLFDNVVSRK